MGKGREGFMRHVETLQPAQSTVNAAGSEIKRNSSELTEQDRRDIERAEGEGMCCWVNTPETNKITKAVGSR